MLRLKHPCNRACSSWTTTPTCARRWAASSRRDGHVCELAPNAASALDAGRPADVRRGRQRRSHGGHGRARAARPDQAEPSRAARRRHHGDGRRPPGRRRHQARRVRVRGQAVQRRGAAQNRRERARRRGRVRARACGPLRRRPAIADLELVGTGPAMRALQTAIDFVARSSAPVLVTGETGVGKELVARAIHARSARASRPFIAVNTSAIPQELLEGEIFGHARGGFTGAIQARKGLLTEADGGTLLLDEIGDMSFGLQAKLLRVLQFGDVRPVGSDRRSSRRRPRHRLDAPRPSGAGEGGAVPRGPLLPAERPVGARPAAARTPRGHPGSGGALPGAGPQACADLARAIDRAGRAPCAVRSGRGRATSASSRAPSSARSSSVSTR